ncbi:hypoxanthine phosphoribosyltransferase [Spiroplasma endosymbiont of Othius punctulatus]|uniref:hypoxanthine phosphoribosyltransferase n=1 Tax=Spiroplasma endosymbiont of Othius punctulatus TaxID=3066289 RepID=UPI0030CC7CD7
MEKHPLIKNILYTKEELQVVIKKVADELNTYYSKQKMKEQTLVIIGVLKSVVPFMAELVQHIKFECITEYMLVSSYLGKTKASSTPKMLLDINISIEDRHVLIVEDILESGSTLKYIKSYLGLRNPKEIKTVTLVDRVNNSKRDKSITTDFTAIKMTTDDFLVGFGFDLDERLRNLPYLGGVDLELYEDWKWDK